MEGGIDDVGIGVLFGLNTYRYDFVSFILMHTEHLKQVRCRTTYHQRPRILFGR